MSTITVQPAVTHTTAHLLLRLQGQQEDSTSNAPPSLQQMTEKLVQEIVDTDVFSEETKAKIRRWYERFRQEFLPHVTTEEGSENASLALCYLLCGAIYPEFESQRGNEANENLLLDLVDKVKEILSHILPNRMNVDCFVDNYRKCFREERAIESALNTIQRCFREKMECLCNDANEFYQNLTLTFNALELLRVQLLTLNANRQAMSAALHQQLDTLTERVSRVSLQLQNISEEIANTGSKLERHQMTYLQAIKEGREMVNKV